MVHATISYTIVTASIAPQVELYTTLACRVHRPDLPDFDTYRRLPRDFAHSLSSFNIFANDTIANTLFKRMGGQPNACSSDPTVQATVAKLSASTCIQFQSSDYS
jgi:hypothetical protein